MGRECDKDRKRGADGGGRGRSVDPAKWVSNFFSKAGTQSFV